MFYSVDGRIVQIDGRFPIFQDNTLIFSVDGIKFPKSDGPNEQFVLGFSQPSQEIEVNWGDGVIETLYSSSSFAGYYGAYTLTLSHNFINPVAEEFKNITFKIKNPELLKTIFTERCFLGAIFPSNIVRFTNLEKIQLRLNVGVEVFPENLKNLTKLYFLELRDVSLPKIPESFLDSPLEFINFESSIDFSSTEGNLDEIIRLQNTLESLYLSRCNISTIPQNLSQLYRLTVLDISSNPLNSSLPQGIYNLPNLKIFTFGGNTNILTLENFELLPQTIESISSAVNFTSTFGTNVPDMSNQINLKYFKLTGDIMNVVSNVDTFINGWYDIVNANASKNLGNTKFRQMTFLVLGRNTTNTPTGTYQQPAGFVLGSNNGTPLSPKEKIWVMVNQYEHTWTYTE